MLTRKEIKEKAYELYALIEDYNSLEAFEILRATKKICNREKLCKY